MLRVGLTGGIACGKSHVLLRLAASGLHTLDLDRVAHDVVARGGSAYPEVVHAFGTGILGPDRDIDRKALGAIVFADPAARARLNTIVHPKVREEEARRASAHAADPAAVFVTDAALLVEAGVHLRFDRLVVVHCAPEEQLRRLMDRDQIGEDAARARVEAQMPIGEKRRFAHFAVDTSGRVEDTHRAADALAGELAVTARSLRPRAALSLERVLACLRRGPASGPRGLSPERLLADIAAAGGLEMERLARLLAPPCGGPWYRCALPQETGPGPERLSGPLVAWALARGGPDPDFLAFAASSLARLTHADPSSVAGACLFALALQDVALGARIAELPRRVPEWTARAERWSGGTPPARLEAMLREAASRPDREEERDLLGALRGMEEGGPVAGAPAALVQALDGLDRIASGSPALEGGQGRP